ncbi:hypothetical protein GCM10025883_19240 [Mobilicoccus caccae]|uniref:Low molecular weight protein antigen 6 PH domain-containing protein n=1 Tax=Mobilicoccus caccae TaxID=1859295 RepID=A0ABQ6IPR9_9MICO|nr:hypothetical protein GCM10025883_19240 [Mobilicoccus caccae]
MVMAVLVLLVFTISAVFVPGQALQKDDWAISDRIMLFLLGAAIAAFLWRFAIIRAVPSPEGLVVRNILVTRRLAWGDIVRLQFGGGSPWAYLDTWDADTVPLMAIQKADGEYGRSEAGRLAALIDYHAGHEPDLDHPAAPADRDATPPPGTPEPQADPTDAGADTTTDGPDDFR